MNQTSSVPTPHPQRDEVSRDPALRIGIFVFDGVEELDFVGPWEVLRVWADQFPEDRVRVQTVARNQREIRCAKGLHVLADRTWKDHQPLDVLTYPGGRGAHSHLGDPASPAGSPFAERRPT